METIDVVPSIEGVFPIHVTLESLVANPDELGATEAGRLFVAWPQPPRAGSRVRLELKVAQGPVRAEPALVIWARPVRPGVTGGFCAQLEAQASPSLDALRALVVTARAGLLFAEPVASRPPDPTPVRRAAQAVRERVSALQTLDFEPRSFLQAPGQFASMPPAAPADDAVERPDDTSDAIEEEFVLELDTERRGGWGHAPSSGQVALELEEASGVELELEYAPPEVVESHAVDVTYASARSFCVHYERFLRHGEVYVTSAPLPPPDEPLRLHLAVPDGAPVLAVDGVFVREVSPPEVPVNGWVARFADPDGAIAERLATATIIAAF